jgi:3-polyprenyl-4-hydroxybenzoate decarboxylase
MAGTVGKLITSYQAGKLSKKQQEELNKKIQAEYDAYNSKKSQFASQIASGSLPQLNISRGNYSPVVGYNPVYAKGGSVRKKYGIGGIADILAGLNLPSLEEISGTYEKYKEPASDIFKLFTSYKAKELAEKQQKELNRKMQESYDKYNKDKSEFSSLISSGNLPKLNIIRGSTPTVKMAMGGITNLRPRTSMGIMGLNR